MSYEVGGEMEKDLIEKVKAALGKSGFPLEMYVAEKLRAVGFEVSQAEYFEDPTSGKQREIDVVAKKSVPLVEQPSLGTKLEDVDFTDFNKTLRLILTIECKSSPEKPWVIFV